MRIESTTLKTVVFARDADGERQSSYQSQQRLAAQTAAGVSQVFKERGDHAVAYFRLTITRHQGDVIDSGSAGRVDYSRDVFEIGFGSASDEQNAGRASRENAAQLGFEILPGNRLRVDLQRAVGCDADHNFARIGRRALVRRRHRLGIQAGGVLRMDHHKNDQQHQQHVDQGRHVDLGSIARAGRACLYGHRTGTKFRALLRFGFNRFLRSRLGPGNPLD